jgi:hypothetical protein
LVDSPPGNRGAVSGAVNRDPNPERMSFLADSETAFPAVNHHPNLKRMPYLADSETVFPAVNHHLN